MFYNPFDLAKILSKLHSKKSDTALGTPCKVCLLKMKKMSKRIGILSPPDESEGCEFICIVTHIVIGEL